ncbi:MAG: cobalamin-binding protein [Candidatus Bathyarchaeota archaeon]|nr:MAG: cobalamin-binding protein [Candidatus Bathyarchaeota archaeon]
MSHKSRTALTIFIILFVAIAGVYWTIRSAKIPESIYPLTVRDDIGRTVELGTEPERVVSLSPGNTEILFALGLDDQIVGVSDYCDHPAQAKEKQKVGGFATISIERVVSLEPDLVLATGGVQLRTVNRLEELGIKTLVLSPKTVEDILNDIELVGKITNKNSEAVILVEELKNRIRFIESATFQLKSTPRVYYEIWHSPLMSAGQDTWINELIDLAGGINIFSDSSDPYPIISSELVIYRDPEIIIIKRGYMGGIAKEDIEVRPGWNRITAVKMGRIYEIDEDILIRPGPRIIDGLEALAAIIHPQLFA